MESAMTDIEKDFDENLITAFCASERLMPARAFAVLIGVKPETESQMRARRQSPTFFKSGSGPVTYLCRSKCSFKELSLKVGDGEIGWHIKALFTRRSSRREKDMPHDEGYDCYVSRTRRIFTRPADGFAAPRCA